MSTTFTTTSGFVDELQSLEDVLSKYPILRRLQTEDQPCYCLPVSMIECLAVWSDYFRQNKKAEIAYTLFTTSYVNRIGFYGLSPIYSRLLDHEKLTQSVFKECPSELLDGFLRHGACADRCRLDMVGSERVKSFVYEERQNACALVAAMMLDMTFMAEHDGLMQSWRRLPSSQQLQGLTRGQREFDYRPPIISGKFRVEFGQPEETVNTMNKWQKDFIAFLDRYYLEKLDCWGLPQPLGTSTLPGQLVNSICFPDSCPVTYTHPLFPMTERDRRFGSIEELQRGAFSQSSISRFQYAAKRSKEYADIFQILHYEKVILQRTCIERGQRAKLSEALGTYLGIDDSRVNSHRSEIKRRQDQRA
jgi:hypothetical protein